MQIIPAIDLLGGRCVRLAQGEFGRQTGYEGDPVSFAERWEREGAVRLHMVDLDGARTGQSSLEHLAIVSRVARSVQIPVQLGGGLRTMAAIGEAIRAGVDRVILGTAAVTDDELARRAFGELGDQAIAGIDARNGMVAVDGWTRTAPESAIELATRLVGYGATRIVFTDIARDGMESGPNVAALRAFAGGVPVPVIASGGVGCLDDIRGLRRAGIANVEAVIVGRALYTRRLDLREAITLLDEEEGR